MKPRDEILALITKISPAERRDVMVAIKGLDQFEGRPAPSQAASGQDLLLAMIAGYLAQRGIPVSVNELRRRNAFVTYKAKLPALMDFVADLEKRSDLGSKHRRLLMFLIARALGDMLTKRGYFSTGAMLTNINKIPEALDEAFPGYVKAGGFRLLLKVNKVP